MERDSTRRFTDRVQDYVRFRPRYPVQVAEILERDCGLTPASVVADLGSGTGIFAELLLERGCTVIGVEPNDAMRSAAEASLAGWAAFRSVPGTAEATGLDAASVDFVTAAQAFHWFDPGRTRLEMARILRPGGHVALVWNDRETQATPFLRAYEALLVRRGTDYEKVRHRNLQPELFQSFFGSGGFQLDVVGTSQSLDWEGLLGRNSSSSYVPASGAPGHAEMTRELQEIFDEHEENGRVEILYATRVYHGRLSPAWELAT